MTKKIKLVSDTLDFFEYVYQNARENAMIIMDEEGIVLSINEAFTVNFQYSEDEIVDKPLKILFTQEDQEGMRFEREIENVNTQGVCSDDNYLVNKNKVLTWVSGESVLVKNDRKEGERYIVKIIQSIHEQKTLEKSLRDSNNFVERILKCIQDGLVVVNSHFRIVKANNAFCNIFCPEYDTVEGEYLFDVNQAFSSDPELKKRLQDVMAGNICLSDREIALTDTNNKKRYFKLSTSIIDEHAGKDGQILIVMHEVTVEKELNQHRDDMIGFASHELRNPLANMVLCTELLEGSIEENNIEESRDYLARTKSNIRRLNKIISELHDATKAASGHLQIEKKPFYFEEMVEESIETVKLLYPKYTFTKTGHAPILVNADRYRLAQVLTNYLSNAIKYSFASHDVWVHLKVESGHIIAEVRDEGTGIAKDQIPFIFTRYYRAEKTMNVEGLGLGLYLSSEIIKAHHGRVWLNSKEDEGTTFYFSVPIA